MRSSTTRPSRTFCVFIAFCGAAFVVVATVGIWAGLKFAFGGEIAVGTVVEFHHTGSRNASIVAQVDVHAAGTAPFRWEVEDSLATQSWEVGAQIPLKCARIFADHLSCVVDSSVDLFLWPVVSLLFGMVMLWWSVMRVRST